MRLPLFFLFSLLCAVPSFSQASSSISPEEANERYFEIPRESIYLHLNKSTYLKGEEIWFKAYAYDRKNNLSSLRTKNFSIELFNDRGEVIHSSLHLGEMGSTYGSIKIDSTWVSGNYYLRSSTNWMNNFIEDESFAQKIEIINSSTIKKGANEETSYDFQLLPEGGHIVYNTNNTIGFKLIDNLGNGVSFEKGFLVDETGAKISSFTSNRFGIGKFNLKPSFGKKYHAAVELDGGKEIRASFPEIKRKGISLSINNLFEDNIIIELNTNQATLDELQDKTYYLLIRKDHISKKIPVNFLPGQMKKSIQVKREELFNGVNTITLVNNNVPVLERLLFNNPFGDTTNMSITYLQTHKDSLLFKIETPTNQVLSYDISVSVLPHETKAYMHKNSIVSAFKLENYLRGNIETPKYYFTEIDREKIYDLDLLLLTQGWSKYEWNTIFNNPPKILFEFESGLIVKGKLQNKTVKDLDKIYMFASRNSPPRIIELDKSNNSFLIADFYPEKGEKIKFSAIKSNGKFTSTGLYLQSLSNQYKKSFLAPRSDEKKYNIVFQNVEIPDFFIKEDIEKLDEVRIKTKYEKQSITNDFIPEYIKKNSTEVTEKLARSYPNILDYIGTQGYRVRYGSDGLSTTATGNVTLIPLRLKSAFASVTPQVFLDDLLLTDLDILFNYSTSDVERIHIDPTGSVSGFTGAGAGVIRIYSRKTPLNGFRKNSGAAANIESYEIKNGFEPKKQFYNPEYVSFSNSFFSDYGTIHWEPKVTFHKDGEGILKIPDTSTKQITFFIEGIRSDGSLISKEITINTSGSN
ncbi:hypothetical protein M0D21_19160 [Aquimarina sp. D1M17]|uniref:hypothetical protein n=1 Tax=Aquimarina acroporae TaxID=2937283 RepID=UPI0020BFB98E|nr:hypothetical protein [Aquimarina acroporae]MCK8523710.1 hypothetical protein [Aquimarina acroporae]